jgi:hypothetical protein
MAKLAVIFSQIGPEGSLTDVVCLSAVNDKQDALFKLLKLKQKLQISKAILFEHEICGFIVEEDSTIIANGKHEILYSVAEKLN